MSDNNNAPRSWTDRLPGWPSERFMIILMTWGMGVGMLIMAKIDRTLWNQELYKTLLTLIIGTGFINMILANYFAANVNDDKRVDNTSKALEAITATANSNSVANPVPDVTIPPGGTATIAAGDTSTSTSTTTLSPATPTPDPWEAKP